MPLKLKRKPGKRKGPASASAFDPTRTFALRRQMVRELSRRFKRLKGLIVKLLVDEDAFGLLADERQRREAERQTAALNAFCPTGPGGGVDPTCSPSVVSLTQSDHQAIALASKMLRTAGEVSLSRSLESGGFYNPEGKGPSRDELERASKILEKQPGRDARDLADWLKDLAGGTIRRESSQAATSVVEQISSPSHVLTGDNVAAVRKDMADKVSSLASELNLTESKHEPGWWFRTVDLPGERRTAFLGKTAVEGSVPAFIVRSHSVFSTIFGGNSISVRAKYATRDQAAKAIEDALAGKALPPTTANAFCPTGEGGGVDPSCGSGGGIGARLSRLADKIPVVGRVKRAVASAMGKVKDKLAQRYGEKAAKAIMTGGALGGYAVAGASFALTGVPGIPFVNDLVSLAVGVTAAEIGKQARRILGNAAGDEAMQLLADELREALRDLDWAASPEEAAEIEKLIAESRIASNAFCPTGEGGGIDPSCSPVTGSKRLSEAARDYAKNGTKAKAFKEWFGDWENDPAGASKVVENNGEPQENEPLIVYHGTHSRFDEFSYQQAGEVGGSHFGDGFYFTPNEDYANYFASENFGGKKGNVLKVFLNIRNPYVVQDHKEYSDLVREFGDANTVNDYLKKQGHDGLKIERFEPAIRQFVTEWVAFEPTQIKSAKNKGTFDSNSPNIRNNRPTTNERWRFQSSPDKVKAFLAWLREQVRREVLGRSENELWRKYIEEGFRKGAGRAFEDVRRPDRARSGATEDKLIEYRGGRQEFLRSAFGRPESIEKVKLLASRTYMDLEGATEQMATAIGRTLMDGLVRGENPRTIARSINEDVDGIGLRRANVIARTEIIRVHAEAQLDAFEALGVEEVGVMVEWATAAGPGASEEDMEAMGVCPACSELQGVVLRIQEARGMLPRHPG